MEISIGMNVLMQKKIEKAEFDRIMEEHSLWLKDKEKGKRADLKDRDLSELDLSGMDFSYADMEGVNLMNAKLVGANLSHAFLRQAYLHKVDMTGATIEGAEFSDSDITLAILSDCKGNGARFDYACMWDCQIKNATLQKSSFFGAQICNCNFAGSDLEKSCFVCADFDDSRFVNTNLKDADLCFADRTYWTDFANSDMTGIRADDVDLNPENIKGVKGLYMPLFCPEVGAFTAWKKCREGKVVKLLIPEHAKRQGNTLHSCRASEAEVLEIYDADGNTSDEAISISDENFKYVKGETVKPNNVDPKHVGDKSGIYFVLSREETKFFEEKSKDDDYEDECEDTLEDGL